MSGADWEMFGRESADYASAVMDRFRERREARAEALRDERERFELNVERFKWVDSCARQAAIKDALLHALREVAPDHELCSQARRTEIADSGLREFVRNGRVEVDHALVVSRGIIKL